MPPKKKVKVEETPAAAQPVFAGITFAISGTLSQPRAHFESMISTHGGSLASSVTRKVSYLISTPTEVSQQTVKVQTAQANSTPIVNEQFLLDSIASGSIPSVISKYSLIESDNGGDSSASEEEEERERVAKPKKTLEAADKLTCLSNVTFAISGTLSVPRKQFENLISKHGGKVASSITKAVNYLISTEKEFEEETSKVAAANDKEIPIVSEDFVHDWIENGLIPQKLSKYKFGENEDDDEENDEDNEEEEDDDGDQDEDDDDDEEQEPPIDLDPHLPPYSGPSLLHTCPSDIFQVLFKYLKLKDILNLWKTGGKELRDQIASSIHQLEIVLVDPLKLSWPRCVSYFPKISSLSVSCPEYYHHMPIEDFSASSIPASVTALSLTFGNASSIFDQINLRSHFRSLESLKIGGNQISRGFFVMTSSVEPSVTMAVLDGLTSIDFSNFEIGWSKLNLLPKSLLAISNMTLVDDRELSPNMVQEEKYVLPENLESIQVKCGELGGLFFSLLPAVSKSLHTLKVECRMKPNLNQSMLSDQSFESLPKHLKTLELNVQADLGADFPLLTRAILPTLPHNLTCLNIMALPIKFESSDLNLFSRDLKTLRLPDLTVSSLEDLQHLPPGITNLRLWSLDPQAFTEETFDMLPCNLQTLEMNFHRDAVPQFKRLPKSITDLRIGEGVWSDEDGEPFPDLFPANLKYLRYYSDYTFLHGPLNSLPKTAVSFIADGDVDWEGDNVEWPPKLQHFSASSVNFDDDFTAALPRKLKSISYPNEDSDFAGEFFDSLPRRLAVFELSLVCPACTVAQVKKLPKRLARLQVDAREWTKKHFLALPKTLGELSIGDTDPESMTREEIENCLPAHCRVI